jgi:hypothetical protein
VAAVGGFRGGGDAAQGTDRGAGCRAELGARAVGVVVAPELWRAESCAP